MKKDMMVLLAGGGTLGPVTPLLALAEAWRKQREDISFALVGTQDGPERSLAQASHIPFYAIPSVRLPRFFSMEWFLIPFRAVYALAGAHRLLRAQRPDLIIGAGGFTQVPVMWVGRFLGVPSFLLQTDVRPLLSNRLVASFVKKIFIGFEETMPFFSARKTVQTGVPVRASLKTGSRERACARFGLDGTRPTLLVLGGGTGSLWINERMAEIAPQLVQEMNVIHLTGRGKQLASLTMNGYASMEQVEDGLADIYAAADLVVARAGMGTISELCALSKPALIIPLPGSAQLENARALARRHAAMVRFQSSTSADDLQEEIRGLISDSAKRKRLSASIHRALNTDVADVIITHLTSHS